MAKSSFGTIIWLCFCLLVTNFGGVFGKRIERCGLKVPSDVATTRPSKMVIAHRGASFNLPEHSLEAYLLAMEQGADYIEANLVTTSDGIFVALHSLDLNLTTNVQTVYPNRLSYSEHHQAQGYWVFNFTYKELQSLKLNQRLPDARTKRFDNLFAIPRLDEILDLWHHWNENLLPKLIGTANDTNDINSVETRKLHKRVGLYVEAKDPALLQSVTQVDNMASKLLDELIGDKGTHSSMFLEDKECDGLKYGEYLVPNLVLQSFDAPFLKEVHDKWIGEYNSSVVAPMVLLVTKEQCFDDQMWFELEKNYDFVQGIAPDKPCLTGAQSKEFMAQAREHELVVHTWTERPEIVYVDKSFLTMEEEIDHLVCTVGVDGIFSEDVTTARVVVRRGCQEETPTPSPATDCSGQQDTVIMGFAAGAMGLLVGSIATFWISQSRMCRSRRHRNLQLRIPTHEDVEMI